MICLVFSTLHLLHVKTRGVLHVLDCFLVIIVQESQTEGEQLKEDWLRAIVYVGQQFSLQAARVAKRDNFNKKWEYWKLG